MREKKGKFIIDVAPLVRLTLSKGQSFSYLWDEKLDPGTLVSVPLFKRSVEGVVLGNQKDFHRFGNIELKRIEKILEKNFLDKNQIELANFISEYYFSPLGIVFKSFIPKRVKQRTMNNESRLRNNKNIRLTKEQEAAVKDISNSKLEILNSKFLLSGPAGSGKTEVYIHSILKLKERDPKLQFLILLPELTLTPQAIERYGQYFAPEEIAVLHSKISKGQFYSYWQKIKSGQTKIIIGSRMAVFAPFQKLGLVVIDEEQDMSFKQWDMNPRYDARTVAEKLTEIHHCRIVFGSATPRVETYGNAEAGKIKTLAIPYLREPKTQIEIVDMKKERWTKNYSIISKALKGELAYVLKNKLQAILFINRQGISSFSLCTSCRKVLKCPKCERALVFDSSGIYRCLHCQYKSSVIPQCPHCHGIQFENIGIGTQKVERELGNLFPSARIIRADSQTMKSPGAQEKLYDKFSRGEADILIGTQMITKGWDLPGVALVSVIDSDAMLSIPDFSATARAFQNILQLVGRVERPGSKFPGKVILQTFYPENRFFQKIANRDFSGFYRDELNERSALLLPPFGKLIKIIFQDTNQERVEKESEIAYNILQEKIGKNAQISEPQLPFVHKVRGRYRKQIVIKLKKQIVSQNIKAILAKLERGWIIDVDPISII